jgi:predicted Zn finger-like uncharacterized protein
LVVVCPKCKTKLRVDEGKLSIGGSRFKCPKCNSVLLVKKPQPPSDKKIDNIKILVAHSNPKISGEITSLLNKDGYQTIIASDGIEAMVKAIKEFPYLAIIEVGIPKIYGFEVCKRLKLRPETKGMKFILVSSAYDKNKYRREPESLYGADDYIEEHLIGEVLVDSVNALRGKQEGKKEEVTELPREEETAPKAEPKTGSEPQRTGEKIESAVDEKIERAKRLARTIVSDIYLYNTAKADESVRRDNFSTVFASEIKEGLKLYESRIGQDIRSRGDFFHEAIRDFVENKKKIL